MPYVIAEYIWIDADSDLRSKTKVMHGKSEVTLDDLSEWNFDGSSTKQAPGDDSEVIIKPRAIFKDPFRGGNHVLVLTDCYDSNDNPIPSNMRAPAQAIMDKVKDQDVWCAIEQEYTMFANGAPLGWPNAKARSFGGPAVQIGFPGPQGPYYCGAGADVCFGRNIAEEHLMKCLDAGVAIGGVNSEVMPGQFEFQIGPCTGIEASDHLWVARYILTRIGEDKGVMITLNPKPVPGDWNGAGCHVNFSTKRMREGDNAIDDDVLPAVKKLSKKHKEHMDCYGSGNEKRLTGDHETPAIDEFTYGIADRGASVRIPNAALKPGKGYFEDRRPASNMDPYRVTSRIVQTVLLE